MPRINWDRLFADEDDYKWGQGLSGRQYDPTALNEQYGTFTAPDYDIGQIRNRRQTSPYGNRQEIAPPTYDLQPLERYHQYLNTEPTREQYQPRGWRRVLNAATAGLQGYQTGSPVEGLKLGQYLNETPYREAYEGWKTRGGKLERAAQFSQEKYKSDLAAYNQRIDNERAERALAITQQNADLQLRKFENLLTRQQIDDVQKGWQLKPGPEGKSIMVRVGPTGEPEVKATDIPNERLTAAELKDQFKQREAGATARSNAAISAANARAAAGRQQSAIQFDTMMHHRTDRAAAEDWSTAVSQGQRQQEIEARGTGRPVTVRGTDTAIGLLENQYPELKGNEAFIRYNPQTEKYEVNSNQGTVMKALREMAGSDDEKFKQLSRRWAEWFARAQQYR